MRDDLPFSDSELMAYNDGELDPVTARAIERNPAARARAQGLAQETARLERALYRATCPDVQLLGEYHQDYLEEARAREIAAHTATCPHCQMELAALTTFMSARSEPQPGGVGLRVLIARLIAGPKRPGPLMKPALAGQRGGPDQPYEYATADGIHISVEATRLTGGGYALLGLVTGLGQAAWRVNLIGADGTRLGTTLDEFASFELATVPAGDHQLELRGDDMVVRIESLTLP